MTKKIIFIVVCIITLLAFSIIGIFAYPFIGHLSGYPIIWHISLGTSIVISILALYLFNLSQIKATDFYVTCIIITCIAFCGISYGLTELRFDTTKPLVYTKDHIINGGKLYNRIGICIVSDQNNLYYTNAKSQYGEHLIVGCIFYDYDFYCGYSEVNLNYYDKSGNLIGRRTINRNEIKYEPSYSSENILDRGVLTNGGLVSPRLTNAVKNYIYQVDGVSM